MPDTRKQGPGLVNLVDTTRLEPDELALWWLGQQSFILKLAGKTIYMDPFLTDAADRLVPPLLKPEQVTNADLILGSHDHADHIDRPAWPGIASASPDAIFIVPSLLREEIADSTGIDTSRIVGIDDGQTLELGKIRITAIASAHEFLDQEPLSGRFPYLGYVIEGGGLCLYHAGDSCIYEGLVTKLRNWEFDVMCLPINGRDAKRLRAGCIGNMTYQEAVDLAGTLRTRFAVPAHYDMFASNSGDPDAFTDYMRVKFPRVSPVVCDYGEALRVRRKSE